MSYKIYEAYRVEGISTLLELKDWVDKLRPLAQARMLEVLRKLSEQIADPDQHPAQAYFKKIFWSKDLWTDHLEPKLEIVFIPSRGGCLVLPYSERAYKYTELLLQLGARYWGFWNNSDPDEYCPEEEWDQRESDWREAMDDNAGVPAEIGFTITVIPDYFPLPQLIYPNGSKG